MFVKPKSNLKKIRKTLKSFKSTIEEQYKINIIGLYPVLPTSRRKKGKLLVLVRTQEDTQFDAIQSLEGFLKEKLNANVLIALENMLEPEDLAKILLRIVRV